MRTAIVCIVGVFAGMTANAGYVEIGSGLNGATGISTGGLDQLYFGTTTPAPTTNGFVEKGYNTTLFLNDTLSQAAPGTTASSQQFTDPNNGVPFAMIGNTANGGTAPDSSPSNPLDDYWQGSNNTTPVSSAITVPIGISSVSEAYIMLTEAYGVTADTYSVQFNFATGAPLVDTLTIGNQIADDQDCSTAGTYAGAAGPCTAYVQTTTSGNTDTAFQTSYTNSSSSTTIQYSGSTGNISLLDLAFNLSAYSNNTLQSITITDPQDQNNESKLALSAITVETPEPSTIVLLLAGCGLIGIRKLRSRA